MKTITIKAFLVNELGDLPKLRAISSYRTFNSSIKEDLRESAELEKDLLRQEVLFTEAGDVIKIIEDELGHTLLRDYHSTLDIPINIHDKVDYTPIIRTIETQLHSKTRTLTSADLEKSMQGTINLLKSL